MLPPGHIRIVASRVKAVLLEYQAMVQEVRSSSWHPSEIWWRICLRGRFIHQIGEEGKKILEEKCKVSL
jgi:hypothetical protein